MNLGGNLEEIILIGYGENANVIVDIIEALDNCKIIGYIDKANKDIKYDYLGTDESFFEKKLNYNNYKYVITVGDIKLRKKIWRKYSIRNVRFQTLIHPKSLVAKDCIIGEGTIIMKGTIIQSNVNIGKNSIINTGVIIEHDNKIGSFCHLAPGVITGGGVEIFDCVFIGLGSIIRDHIVIEENSFIKMGTVFI